MGCNWGATIKFWEFIDFALGCRNFSSTVVIRREIMQSEGMSKIHEIFMVSSKYLGGL